MRSGGWMIGIGYGCAGGFGGWKWHWLSVGGMSGGYCSTLGVDVRNVTINELNMQQYLGMPD